MIKTFDVNIVISYPKIVVRVQSNPSKLNNKSLIMAILCIKK